MPSTGWKRDLPEHVRESERAGALHRAERYGVARTSLPRSVNELGRHCFVRDQGQASACVGFGITGAVYARLRYLGFGVGLFSAQACYSMAIALEGIHKGKPLPDEGSYPYLAMMGIRRYGIPEESAWPFDINKIHQEVPFDVFQKASQFRVSSFARIDLEGDARVDACKRALANGHPIPFGMQVGREFMDYASGKGPIGVETDDTGGHMTFLVGYEDDGDVFIGCNSWSRGWGDDGFYRITRDKLTHSTTTDLYDFTITDARMP